MASLSDLNELEQANILQAYQWAARKKKIPLTDAFARKLHAQMFGHVWKWAGSYRTSNKNIGIPWPRVPEEVRKLCDDASYWQQHQTYSKDELGARLHHRLVFIHPFPNGNGRHGRLFTDLVMVAAGQRPFTWGAGDIAHDAQVRRRYLEALRSADAKNWKPLLAFIRS